MRDNKLALYVHLVWSTWDRSPLISPEVERPLYRNIAAGIQHEKCTLIALGGTDDHIHMLVSMPSTLAVADLVKQIKGVSSHFVNETLRPDYTFKWQGAYGAFTVSRWDVDSVTHYIHHQKEHHAAHTLMAELEM